MNILYLDCSAGISGDMFLSALFNAGLDKKELLKELEKLKLKNKCSIHIKNIIRNGISATRFVVDEDKDIERGIVEVEEIILKSELEKEIKEKVLKMFNRLYLVEKKIHRKFHHFHELGLLDTIIDITGAIIALKLLNIEKIFASKINIGSGFVNTSHGLLPVPLPATAELLKGMPVYSFGPQTELVTPTGALILKEFVSEFRMPEFRIKKIGYGAGLKKFDNFPNILRAFIGEIEKRETNKLLIETNIDDFNPQFYEYLMEKLFQNNALDVTLTPVYMKKNRPGILLSCICNDSDKDKIIETIFKETTTIGVRILHPERIELEREKKVVKTEYGEVEVKISRYNSEIVNISPEYESCKRLAKSSGVALKKIYHTALKELK